MSDQIPAGDVLAALLDIPAAPVVTLPPDQAELIPGAVPDWEAEVAEIRSAVIRLCERAHRAGGMREVCRDLRDAIPPLARAERSARQAAHPAVGMLDTLADPPVFTEYRARPLLLTVDQAYRTLAAEGHAMDDIRVAIGGHYAAGASRESAARGAVWTLTPDDMDAVRQRLTDHYAGLADEDTDTE